MTSKAERKRRVRRRAQTITLPGGDAVPAPIVQGSRTDLKPKEDPMNVVTDARMRKLVGLRPEDAPKGAGNDQVAIAKAAQRAFDQRIDEAKSDARQPICGTDMGLCIRHIAKGDERADLVNAWSAISAAHRNYRLLIIGQTGDPQGAAIPMLAEPMETDPSLRVDLRTHEQRIEAAKRAWGEWWAKIKALPVPNLRWAISGALDGFMGDGALWRDQGPTATGSAAVQALRMMLDK